ncbi:hypothetical protein AGDE_00160 [Angomonas deanei]|nr:hypothetical protein AGDE_00160 [Angomonas deanei]|eukprot:EPY43761.1 hypothetical protein AGDE_00160 [Angomonas deanei]
MAKRAVHNKEGLITQAEWDAIVGSTGNSSGKSFRYVLGLIVLLMVGLLLFSKYDEEYNVEVPQVETGKGFGEILRIDTHTKSADPNAEDLEKYYAALGIEDRIKNASFFNSTATGEATTEEDPDKARRRENYRVRKEIERAYREHQEQQGQLVACGTSCQAENKQVELAYQKLASQVDRELFGVLLDAKDTKSVRSTSQDQLKKKFEEKKKIILETEKNEEDRQMALEELKDAYEILQDPDARKYYLLYGAKPPEAMRYVSARDGGWGQDMALGTSKYKFVIMWLDYLQSKIGVWGETIVLLSVVAVLLSRLPQVLKQTDRIIEELDWQDKIRAEAAAKAAAQKLKQK